MGSWNVRGWSLDPSQQLRSNVVKALELDIVCVCETFLIGEQELDIEGYIWVGNNRKVISKRACRGSGGVGILVRACILDCFDIAVVSNKFEGILWVNLIHKSSRRSVGICTCYLPPVGSSRGDRSQEFLDSLKALIIDNYHVDDFVLCGDFNARCGDLQETSDIHSIPRRTAIDTTYNQMGKELISALDALEMCILNGRLSPDYDDFTSVSPRGMSVVDYIITPAKSFSLFSNFRVLDP